MSEKPLVNFDATFDSEEEVIASQVLLTFLSVSSQTFVWSDFSTLNLEVTGATESFKFVTTDISVDNKTFTFSNATALMKRGAPASEARIRIIATGCLRIGTTAPQNVGMVETTWPATDSREKEHTVDLSSRIGVKTGVMTFRITPLKPRASLSIPQALAGVPFENSFEMPGKTPVSPPLDMAALIPTAKVAEMHPFNSSFAPEDDVEVMDKPGLKTALDQFFSRKSSGIWEPMEASLRSQQEAESPHAPRKPSSPPPVRPGARKLPPESNAGRSLSTSQRDASVRSTLSRHMMDRFLQETHSRETLIEELKKTPREMLAEVVADMILLCKEERREPSPFDRGPIPTLTIEADGGSSPSLEGSGSGFTPLRKAKGLKQGKFKGRKSPPETRTPSPASNKGENDSGSASEISDGADSDNGHEEPVFTPVVTYVAEDGFDSLNQYTILKELGTGACGTVVLAHHNEQAKYFAIKAVRRRKFTANYAAEIEVMKQLRHANVLPLYEVMDDIAHKFVYLVMKYAENGAVLQLNEKGECKPLELLLARNYMKQLSRGLHYLHDHSVAHHDIKPENILLGENDVVYLSDFGVSSVLEQDEFFRSLTYVGTPSYTSPEQIKSHKTHEEIWAKACDVWSLGATFFVFLFGRLPYRSDTLEELEKKIINDPVEFPKAEEVEWATNDKQYDVSDLISTVGNSSISMESSTVSPQQRSTQSPGSPQVPPSFGSMSVSGLLLFNEAVDLIKGMMEKDPEKRLTIVDVRDHPFFHSHLHRPRGMSRSRKSVGPLSPYAKAKSPRAGVPEVVVLSPGATSLGPSRKSMPAMLRSTVQSSKSAGSPTGVDDGDNEDVSLGSKSSLMLKRRTSPSGLPNSIVPDVFATCNFKEQ